MCFSLIKPLAWSNLSKLNRQSKEIRMNSVKFYKYHARNSDFFLYFLDNSFHFLIEENLNKCNKRHYLPTIHFFFAFKHANSKLYFKFLAKIPRRNKCVSLFQVQSDFVFITSLFANASSISPLKFYTQ